MTAARAPWRRTAAAAALLALLAGCREAPYAALDPAADQAGWIAQLWWWFLAVCTLVFVAVMIALAFALLRRRQGPEGADPATEAGRLPLEVLERRPATERRLTRAVATAAVVSVLILVGLVAASIATGDTLADAQRQERTIELVGHQFWWEVRYPDAVPSRSVTTANEIHLPLGGTVRLQLSSTDVIHSVWVPRLHGKRDLIPGRTTDLWIRATEAGVYSGQCAEFCGPQHAHMGLVVVVEPRDAFERWLAGQRPAARPPRTPGERRGQQVFLSNACVMCHTVRGTPAGGRTGPDLTHLASRRSLGAGILPNRPGHLAGWVLDAQGVKPGSNMPPNPLSGEDLQALLAYLRSLA